MFRVKGDTFLFKKKAIIIKNILLKKKSTIFFLYRKEEYRREIPIKNQRKQFLREKIYWNFFFNPKTTRKVEHSMIWSGEKTSIFSKYKSESKNEKSDLF